MDGFSSLFYCRSHKEDSECFSSDRNHFDNMEENQGPLDMTAMAYSNCHSTINYAGHIVETSKSTSFLEVGSSCYSSSTQDINETGTAPYSPYTLHYLHYGRARTSETTSISRPLSYAPAVASSYLYPTYSETSITGHKSTSPLHLASSFATLRSENPKSTSPLHFTPSFTALRPQGPKSMSPLNFVSSFTTSRSEGPKSVSPIHFTSSFTESRPEGPRSTSPLQFASPFSTSRSEFCETGNARDCAGFFPFPAKSNISDRHLNDESYASECSKPQSEGSRSTPSISSAMGVSHFNSSFTIPVTTCSSVIQSLNDSTSNNESNIDIACHDSDNMLSPEDTSTSRIVKNPIMTVNNNGQDTVLPNYSNETVSGAHPSSDSNRNKSHKQNYKKKKMDFDKMVNNGNHRSNTLFTPELQSKSNNMNHRVKRPKTAKSKNNSEKGNGIPRPPYSYVALIQLAILSSPKKMLTLQDIYKYVLKNFEYYEHCKVGWKNSIRHNLSLNDCFYKLTKEGSKGSYWLFNFQNDNINQFQNNNFRRRIRMKNSKKSKAASQRSTTASVRSTVTPTLTQPIPYSYYRASELFNHGYPPGSSSDRNWSLSHMTNSMRHSGRYSISSHSTYPCSQGQGLHVGYSQTPDPVTTSSTQTSLILPTSYPDRPYVPPSSFSGFYPGQYCRDAYYSPQQNQCYRPF